MRQNERHDHNGIKPDGFITNGFCMPSLIKKKRDGGKLTKHEIEYFIKQVVKGHIQDGQLGRFEFLFLSLLFPFLLI